MRFWDASAAVPLLLPQRTSAGTSALLAEDPQVVVWWATETECISALARIQREGLLVDPGEARGRLSDLAADWDEVAPSQRVRSSAERLLGTYPLRAADALQLAAALDWCDGETRGCQFVCLDDRLRDAARSEGFTVLP